MKGYRLILLCLVTLLLSACVHRRPAEEYQRPVLGVTLEFPAPVPTKVEVPASDQENMITDLQIWVFHATTHELVASLSLDGNSLADDFPQAGSVKRYSMPVSWDFALERPRPAVDVFVLANAATLGLSLDGTSDYDTVNDASFGGDLFAPASKVTSVPATGLPMSGVSKGMAISGEEPSLNVAPVSLERAVSKVRFVFCQMQTDTDNDAEKEVFSVEKIELDGGMIPQEEYVFATSAPRVGTAMHEAVQEYPGSTGIAFSDRPEEYVYRGQDGPTYEKVLSDAFEAGKLTETGTYYLKESGEMLSGTIYYRVEKGKGTTSYQYRSGTARFSMKKKDFARNHTWTVYGYYVSKRTLQLSVSVLPWSKSDYNIKFSEQALMVTWKLSVLNQSVSSIDPVVGQKDHYTVKLKSNSAASAYLYVVTPEGGTLKVIPEGDTEYFLVSFGDNPEALLDEATINPSNNSGRLDLSIDRRRDTPAPAGASITLSFRAFTVDEREIDGASECIDQIYHFTL